MPRRTTATPIAPQSAVVAVTGAARGIGRATAAAFVARGARVALGDLDEAAAREAAASLGPRAESFELDVTDRESFARFLEQVETSFGPLDVLVNNAGVMSAAPFLSEDEGRSELTYAVNLFGPANGMRLALPGMVERGRGHIVNVISLASKIHVPGLSSYVASKFALLGLHRTVREELLGTGVTMSAILPTAVRTEFASGVPLGGLFAVEPEVVANAIVATLRRRPAEVTIPRWLRVVDAWALLPAFADRLIRRGLRQDRAITAVDAEARAAYEARIAAAIESRPPRGMK